MTSLSHHTSFDRLEVAARSGNTVSMARLYVAIRPVAVRRARAELDPDAAESVADTVCLAVVNSLVGASDLVGVSGEPLLHRVYSMTNRLIARAGSESRIPLPAGMAGLPEREREVLILRLIVGLDADSTAAALDCTRSRILLDQHRALTALRVNPVEEGRVVQ